MNDFIASIMMLLGAGFMLLAGIGVTRLPDLFTRMHAATKSGTLGVSGMILAVGVHFYDMGIAVRAILVVIFLFITAPVAAHVIARSAYVVGVPLWERSVADELKGKHDPRTGTLDSFDPETEAAEQGEAPKHSD